MKLRDFADGKLLKTFQGPADNAYFASIVFTPDGQWLLSHAAGFSVWDPKTGQLQRMFGREPGLLSNLVVTAAGQWLVVDFYIRSRKMKLWDVANGLLLNTIDVQSDKDYVLTAAISPNGRWIASVSQIGQNYIVNIFDAATGRLARTFEPQPSFLTAVSFSPDSRQLAVAGGPAKTIKIWNVESGQLYKTISTGDTRLLVFSPDGRWIVSDGLEAISHDPLKLWDVAGGKLVRSFKHDGFNLHALAISPDGRLIVSTGGLNNVTNLWEAASGRLVKRLDGNPGSGKSIAFSPDSRLVVVTNLNGTTAVWSAETGVLLTTTIRANSGEWVTITPEGFFVASEKGAELLHIVQGFETTGIDQLYQSLYRPDLVRRKLAGDPGGLVREAAAQLDLTKVVASGNAPAVRVVSPVGGTSATSSQITAEVEIEARGGGVGRIEWRVNGLTIGVETAATQPPVGQSIRLTRNLSLDTGDNIIEVVAYNSTNLIASVPARTTVAAQVIAPGTPSVKPRLFVLAAGLNDYADGRFKLAYSVQDAKAMAQAFIVSGKGLYESVEVKVMSDADVTRDKLDAAFNDLAGKITPADTFVLYLAGHGKTVDGRYYFIPQNFKVDGEATNAKVDAAVKSQGIAQEQWQRWFAQVSAKKSMILFDTCESGTLTGDESETKTLERGGANDRLAQATGRSIITASTGSTEAIEGYHGHGLFTYNVLDALDHGDGDNNGTIEVTELAAYVYVQVTAISERVFKQRQEPQMKITSNYALTRQAHVLQDATPLIAMENKPTYQLAQTAQLQIRPSNGATVVRSLSAKTAVTVLKSEGGWSLIASEGKPLGYVATRDLVPMQ